MVDFYYSFIIKVYLLEVCPTIIRDVSPVSEQKSSKNEDNTCSGTGASGDKAVIILIFTEHIHIVCIITI